MRVSFKKVLSSLIGLILLTSAVVTPLTTSAYNVTNKQIYGSYFNSDDNDIPTINTNTYNEYPLHLYKKDGLIEFFKNFKFKYGLGVDIFILNEMFAEYSINNEIIIVDITNRIIRFNDVEIKVSLSKDELYNIISEATESLNDTTIAINITSMFKRYESISSINNEISYYDLICCILNVDTLDNVELNKLKSHFNLDKVDTVVNGINENGEIINLNLPDYGIISDPDFEVATYNGYEINAFTPMRCMSKDIYNKLNVSTNDRRSNNLNLGITVACERYTYKLGNYLGIPRVYSDKYSFDLFNSQVIYNDLLNTYAGLDITKDSNKFLMYYELQRDENDNTRIIPFIYDKSSDMFNKQDYKFSSIYQKCIYSPSEYSYNFDFSTIISKPGSGEQHKFYYVYIDTLDETNPTALTGLFTLEDTFSINMKDLPDKGVLELSDGIVNIPSVLLDDLNIIIPNTVLDVDITNGEICDCNYKIHLIEYTIDNNNNIIREDKDVNIAYIDDPNDASKTDNEVLHLVDNKTNEDIASITRGGAIVYTDEMLEVSHFDVTGNTYYVYGFETIYSADFTRCWPMESGSLALDTTFADYLQEYPEDYWSCELLNINDQNSIRDYTNNISTAISNNNAEITHQPIFSDLESLYMSMQPHTYKYLDYYQNILYGPDSYEQFIDPDYVDVEYSIMDFVKVKKFLLGSAVAKVSDTVLYDLTSDDKITIIDLVSLKKKLLAQ